VISRHSERTADLPRRWKGGNSIIAFRRLWALREWVGLALAVVIRLLLFGVVTRECLRLVEAVVVAGQCFDEPRV
jgi:hypothetical protein